MKIIKENFDAFAREQGYENGAELYDELKLDRDTYDHYKKEVPIGKTTLKILCWELGAAEVMELVQFASGERVKYREILEGF